MVTNKSVKNIPYNIELSDLKKRIAVANLDAISNKMLFGWQSGAAKKARLLLDSGENEAAMIVYDEILEGRKSPENTIAVQKKYAA